MSDEAYTNGTLVWAKMKGFPPWPGRVTQPPPDLKRPASKKAIAIHCIFFFGSKNYAWIEENNLKPYLLFKDQLVRSNKSSGFREAVDAIENFIENNEEAEGELNGVSDYKETMDTGATSSATNSESDKIFDQIRDDKVKPKRSKGRPKRSLALGNISVSSTNLDLTSKRAKTSDDGAGSSTSLSNHTPGSSKRMFSLLDRPLPPSQPRSEPIDIKDISNALRERKIEASNLKFGFLGLGNMGAGIVKNLLNSGHTVTVWSRVPDKITKFVEAGATKGQTPCDVVADSDITFSCVANPQVAKDMVFGNCGALQEMKPGKSYVEMTGIDAETSEDIAEAITGRGGRYLEAQIQGSKAESEEGTLVILAAGDRSLFEECQSCFVAMSKNSFFLGDVGSASKMNLVLQLMNGIMIAGLAEGMALADRAGLQQKDLLEILALTRNACPTVLEKGHDMISGLFTTRMPLQHMQKDIRLSLALGDQVEQPLPLAATANEVYKHAKRLGYSEHDMSAVYVRARF